MKKAMFTYALILSTFIAVRGRRVLETLHNWPAWWKILIAVAVSLFAGFCMLYSLDLWSDFLLM
jgi:hypothetical protein